MGSRVTRRRFSAGMAGGAVAVAGRSAFGALGANERVRLGIIGVGNRGDQLIDAFKPHADAEVVAICDVYAPYREFAAKKVGGQPFLTGDFRELVGRKDLDAVIIATPDHWHALPFVHACAAGKHVYVEKPLSLVVSEGRAMIEAAKKHDRVVQVGIHRRSVPSCRKAVEAIRGGAIGKMTACRSFHISNEWPLGIGNPPDSAPPPGLDWDMWLGPAPKVPYNENRCFYKFRWFREYSGGQMTNFGTHWLDLIQWAIGQDAPRGVFAVGTRGNIPDNRGVPDTMEAVWDYPDGTIVSFSQYNANASPGAANKSYVEFRGTEGTMLLQGDGMVIVPEVVRGEPLPALDPTNRKGNQRQAAATRPAGGKPIKFRGSSSDTVHHARNFLDCIKTKGVCNCPIEAGHRSTAATLIANIAGDRKKYLAWDAENERFTNDEEANKALAYEYRAPWQLA
ncbi:MAG: Gfo/Idh/MocA family oxidoreductase [Planctomycetes bacterium]|nr:Gfo/Idh/MocA family oxidoreductase [Planctomycetota bacterium]